MSTLYYYNFLAHINTLILQIKWTSSLKNYHHLLFFFLLSSSSLFSIISIIINNFFFLSLLIHDEFNKIVGNNKAIVDNTIINYQIILTVFKNKSKEWFYYRASSSLILYSSILLLLWAAPMLDNHDYCKTIINESGTEINMCSSPVLIGLVTTSHSCCCSQLWQTKKVLCCIARMTWGEGENNQ